MSFLLDTNVCSAYIKGNQPVFSRFVQYGGRLSISVITAGELTTWIHRKSLSPAIMVSVQTFLDEMPCLDVTRDVGTRYGELRAMQLDIGVETSTADLLIACTALVHDLTVVTHNVRDFSDIPNLRVVDWLA